MLRRMTNYMNSVIPETDNEDRMLTNFWRENKTIIVAVVYGLSCYWVGISVGMACNEIKKYDI